MNDGQPRNTIKANTALAALRNNMNVIESLSGLANTGYSLQLNQADSAVVAQWSKFGAVTVDVNGTSGDFWVKPVKQTDGSGPPAPADPRVLGSALDSIAHGWYQVKSGESRTFGAANSKGYDAQMHGQNFYTHLLVYCVTPGTTTATQLRWVAN